MATAPAATPWWTVPARMAEDFPAAWYNMGNAYEELGLYKEAIKCFTQALKFDAKHYESFFGRGSCYDSLEQYRKALNIYFSLYQKDTINIFLLRNIAKTYDNLEISDSAGVFYEKAVRLYPHDFLTVFRLGNIYIKQKKYERTIDITGNYRFLDSKNIKINRLNAYAIYLLENYKEASIRFNLCVQNNDTSDFSYKYLGLSYFKLEKYDSARIYLEKSLLKDTLNVQTCYALGIACQLSDFNAKGVTYLNKTLELVKPKPKFESEVLQHLAEAYNDSKLYKKGLDALLSANRVTPDDTLLKFRIARQYDSYLQNGKLALKYYAEFMKTRPHKGSNEKKTPLTLSYYVAVEKRIAQLEQNFNQSIGTATPIIKPN